MEGCPKAIAARARLLPAGERKAERLNDKICDGKNGGQSSRVRRSCWSDQVTHWRRSGMRRGWKNRDRHEVWENAATVSGAAGGSGVENGSTREVGACGEGGNLEIPGEGEKCQPWGEKREKWEEERRREERGKKKKERERGENKKVRKLSRKCRTSLGKSKLDRNVPVTQLKSKQFKLGLQPVRLLCGLSFNTN